MPTAFFDFNKVHNLILMLLSDIACKNVGCVGFFTYNFALLYLCFTLLLASFERLQTSRWQQLAVTFLA